MMSMMTIVNVPKRKTKAELSHFNSTACAAKSLSMDSMLNAHLQWSSSYVSGVDPRFNSEDDLMCMLKTIMLLHCWLSQRCCRCHQQKFIFLLMLPMKYFPTSANKRYILLSRTAFFLYRFGSIVLGKLCPCSICSNRLVPNQQEISWPNLHYILGKKTNKQHIVLT